MINRKKIYKAVLNILAEGEATRTEIISAVSEAELGECLNGACPIGPMSEVRGAVGAVIAEMIGGGIIAEEGDKLLLLSSRPIALRAERCEKEIIDLLRSGAYSKREIRDMLVKRFGTDKTSSKKDDNILYSLTGYVLKKLTDYGLIVLDEGKYSIAPEKIGKIENIAEYASLKSELMARIHAKGGEFFEHYILTLLSKHLASTGKRITECYVTGGAADGGIDGIIKTVDALGFREQIMIQAKNRLEITNETAVRSFYGAVCAAQGSRGIFATTSDFHPAAKEFLSGIDNCVGVNSDVISKLAIECLYGVRKRGRKYEIDTKLL